MKANGGVEVELHDPAALPICAIGPIAGMDALEEKFIAPFGALITIPPLSAACSMLTKMEIAAP